MDIVIVGGGIAGISLAARLADHADVAVVEAEEHLGAHATGRSAALLVEAYGPPEIRRLTGASRAFFETPPAGFSAAQLAHPRGALIYAGEMELDRLRGEFDLAARATDVVWLDAEEVLERCPLLRPGIAAAGFFEPGVLDLDTDALLEGFARVARRAGAVIHTSAPVRDAHREAGGWIVLAGEHEFSCKLIANAAGAWADRVAVLAGVAPCGLEPKRRTAATLAFPPDQAELLAKLPFVAPVDERFNFKPEAGTVMVSLAEETVSEPCDAFADELDVATAIERFHAATVVPRNRPVASWAGLRTFAPDRRPVVGFDESVANFFWYAGQGGYGIQTAPALSALAAKLIGRAPLDRIEAQLAAALNPHRLSKRAARAPA